MESSTAVVDCATGIDAQMVMAETNGGVKVMNGIHPCRATATQTDVVIEKNDSCYTDKQIVATPDDEAVEKSPVHTAPDSSLDDNNHDARVNNSNDVETIDTNETTNYKLQK